ncbi:hypothetical protein FA15DRAFT_668178 [Coprinopsis marcescibilis]|uniref:Uncharacterized protein n=1 Tax=Coprinopsis marcescibilis TaxID=230819 RepID=A0A5C3LBI8_COPMA|nr:hypothetical protein FA15DRAFT_668178 [Coprinopsis marcescibilis]
MAKTTKKAPVNSGRPITDFFARATSSSQGSIVSASKPRLKTTTTLAVKTSVQGDDENPFLNHRSPLASQNSTKPSLSQPTVKEIGSSLALASAAPAAPIKRTRSETIHLGNMGVKQRTTNGVQPQVATPRKKARISSPFSASSTVPSSQSDEKELTTAVSVAHIPISEKEEAINSWRQSAHPPTPHVHCEPLTNDMDVDEPKPIVSADSGSSRATTPTAEWASAIHTDVDTSASPSQRSHTRLITPPYTDVSSEDIHAPPTPMDAQTRTKRELERIRAEALADAISSPEPILDVPDELSDSEDEDVIPALSFLKSAPKANAPDSASSGSSGGLRRSSRNLKPQGTTSPRDGSPVSRNARASSSKSVKRAPQKCTAIEEMIKEKTLAEKRGKGEEAIKRAYSLIKKDSFIEDMEVEDDLEDHEQWADLEKLKNMDSIQSLKWDRKYTLNDNVLLDENDDKSAYGEDGAKEINSILRQDKQMRQEEQAAEDAYGVRLWNSEVDSDGDSAMGEAESPAFEYAGNSGTLKLLTTAIHRKDYSKAAFILKSGIFAALDLGREPKFLEALSFLAIKSQEQPLADAAFLAVLQALKRCQTSEGNKISIAFVTETILDLGAQPQILKTGGLDMVPSEAKPGVSAAQRETTLYRMVAILHHAATWRHLVLQDVPNIIIALLLIAMDLSTSHKLRREISVVADLMIHLLSSRDHRDLEREVAVRLVALAANYEPTNKAFLLSLVYVGTGNTLRVARCCAFSMLTQTPAESITNSTYQDPPPLKRLTEFFAQPNEEGDLMYKPSGPFQIDDDTDYSNVKDYLFALGVATSNMEAYVEEQKQRVAKEKEASIAQSPTKKHGHRRPDTDLQVMDKGLERLHAEINDIRAGHLDRSRAKGVAKQLQYRLHYQRLAFERAWVDRLKSKTSVANWLTKGAGSAKDKA